MPKQIVLGVEKGPQLLENRADNRIQRLVDEMNGREDEFLSLGSYTDYCALLNYWLTFLVPPVDPQSKNQKTRCRHDDLACAQRTLRHYERRH